MGRDRAAYMRAYRARRKAAHAEYDEAKPLIGELKSRNTELVRRNAELEAEVQRLKRELAARPASSFVEFRPVPKPERGPSRPADRRRSS